MEKSKAELALDMVQGRLDTGAHLQWHEVEAVLAALKEVVASEKAEKPASKKVGG